MHPTRSKSDDRLRIGVSACLLGREVRYDGRHKRDALLLEELAPLVTFVPVCPELEVGMGVPREPVQQEHGRPVAAELTASQPHSVAGHLGPGSHAPFLA